MKDSWDILESMTGTIGESAAWASGSDERMNTSDSSFPRIRDLPEEEREPFTRWLNGQTVPWLDDVPTSEQDGYYQHDYERWKKRLPVID